MASGYRSVLYRLSGMLPADRPSPDGNVEALKDSLSAYFLGDSLDDVSRGLSWTNFAIPALLTTLQDYIGSSAHKIRLNEFLFRHLEASVMSELGDLSHAELQQECEDRVFGALSLIIDMGSVSAFMSSDDLEAFMYDLFPGLDVFLRQVDPTSAPFVSGELSLDRLSGYMISIQVGVK